MARIKVIQEKEATGELKEIYENLINSRGKLAEVHKIMSLNPKTIISHMALYMDIMYAKSPLSRAQREMMAVVVSRENKCEYCIKHHSEALLKFWKDEDKVNRLIQNEDYDILDPIEFRLAELAVILTSNPGSETANVLISELKKNGLDDRAILDATLVAAYYNFINRVVLGLGVELEEDQGSGYKYDTV